MGNLSSVIVISFGNLDKNFAKVKMSTVQMIGSREPNTL